jgi:hypothetical protein
MGFLLGQINLTPGTPVLVPVAGNQWVCGKMAQKNYTIYYKLTIIFEMDGDCNKGLVVG